MATNTYGDSLVSAKGNGAVILTIPDAPTFLSENYQLRTANNLGLTWELGSADGGSPVIDYIVSYNEGSGNTFVVLESGVLTRTYTAKSLEPGTTYKFKV